MVGAAAGAVLALLNTPQSGRRTRAQLRHAISDARFRSRRAIDKAYERAMSKIDEAQNLIQEIGDEAIHQTERLKMISQDIAEKPKTILEKVKS